MPRIVKPLSWNHKSQMRLLEHGTEWKIVEGAFNTKVNEVLLESVKTGYLKWWPRSHQGTEK